MKRHRILREEGANLVEMALVSLFLLVLAAGTIDFGGAFHDYIMIRNAAREGARLAARLPCKAGDGDLATAIKAAVLRETDTGLMGQNSLQDTDVEIDPDPVDDGCAVPGEPIRVTVTYDYPTAMGGLLGVGPLQLRAQASMAFFGNDQL
jgi:Flp pilus assembly protein TadG